MKYIKFLASLAFFGVVLAGNEEEKEILVKFQPITTEQYESLLKINAGKPVISEGRFISSVITGLTGLATGFQMAKILPNLFGGNNESTVGGYPLCDINANEAAARQSDGGVSYINMEELSEALAHSGADANGLPVINCVLILDDSKEPNSHNITPRPTYRPPRPTFPTYPYNTTPRPTHRPPRPTVPTTTTTTTPTTTPATTPTTTPSTTTTTAAPTTTPSTTTTTPAPTTTTTTTTAAPTTTTTTTTTTAAPTTTPTTTTTTAAPTTTPTTTTTTAAPTTTTTTTPSTTTTTASPTTTSKPRPTYGPTYKPHPQQPFHPWYPSYPSYPYPYPYPPPPPYQPYPPRPHHSYRPPPFYYQYIKYPVYENDNEYAHDDEEHENSTESPVQLPTINISSFLLDKLQAIHATSTTTTTTRKPTRRPSRRPTRHPTHRPTYRPYLQYPAQYHKSQRQIYNDDLDEYDDSIDYIEVSKKVHH